MIGRLLCPLALCASALLAPAAALAVPPTLNSVDQTNRHLTAGWTIGPGTAVDFVEVGTTTTPTSFGSFADLVFRSSSSPTQPYTSEVQFAPGTYYVHAGGCAADPCTPQNVEFSSPLQITIRADLWPPVPPSFTSVGQIARHLTASWDVNPALTMDFIEAATSRATDPDGAFLPQFVVLGELVADQARSYQSPLQLPPGTYYVHVAAFDTNCVGPDPGFLCPESFSSTATLNVPPDAPPLPPPAPDKVTSFSALKCASTQKAGNLVVQASMPENGTITVGGSLNVPNAAKVFKLKAVSVNATPGKTVKITVKLPSKVLKAVKKALKKHKKVKANLTITARDGAGNTKSETRAVKLKG